MSAITYGRNIVPAHLGEICVALSSEGFPIELQEAQDLVRPALIAAHDKIGAGKTRGRFLYNRAEGMRVARQVLRDAGFMPGSPRAAGWTPRERLEAA